MENQGSVHNIHHNQRSKGFLPIIKTRSNQQSRPSKNKKNVRTEFLPLINSVSTQSNDRSAAHSHRSLHETTSSSFSVIYPSVVPWRTSIRYDTGYTPAKRHTRNKNLFKTAQTKSNDSNLKSILNSKTSSIPTFRQKNEIKPAKQWQEIDDLNKQETQFLTEKSQSYSVLPPIHKPVKKVTFEMQSCVGINIPLKEGSAFAMESGDILPPLYYTRSVPVSFVYLLMCKLLCMILQTDTIAIFGD